MTSLTLFNTRRGRVLIENLTAYAFLLPAGIIIFLFGVFPVAFAFFVSLHRWRRFPDEYRGLDNYVRALDGFGYVLFFWAAVAAIGYALVLLYRLWQSSRGKRREWLYVLPGLLNAAAVLLFVRWFALLLPVILDVPQRLRGQERVQGLFLNEFFASFRMPEVADAGNLMLIAVIAALLASGLALRLIRTDSAGHALMRLTLAGLFAAASVLILELLHAEVQIAIAEAQASGSELPIWSQVMIISAGTGLLVAAYYLWRQGQRGASDRQFALMSLAAVALAVGGYFLVAELPRLLAEADEDMLKAFGITVLFVLGTVPVQLTIGLGLAYLLFQNIKGKEFFRMIYFLPYITPFVATSLAFSLIFSHRITAPANTFLKALGLPTQNWLLESNGIFQLAFGESVPDALAGPSLALVVIMLYTIWTYVGYDTVVFLAGLVNIPAELYEAARIDGGSEWTVFRRITLPLLSPTTFFLSLIAIIGTFQAFTQVWIMRTPAAAESVDTVSVYIFETVRATDPNMGYGSAMSIVLFVVILLLTVLQNRLAERNVFYG